MSLEELAQVDVDSVSRRAEPLAEAAGAVFVISADDIRNSGASSLPEVLRLAPNLQVQRVNSSDYAISARGFNGFETANKVLVLIDGRSIYTTLFSGVLWDAQGLVLDDIERIDVVSGPGGALYGANAVNGVINIITKHARTTPGGAATLTAGNEDRVLTLRQGFSRGDWAGRIFLMGFERDESLLASGADAADASRGVRGGFRADWAGAVSSLTLQGDLYDHDVNATGAALSGGFASAAWSRPMAGGGDLRIQAYYDVTNRVIPGSDETVATSDVFLQHAVAAHGRHSLTWGGGYRLIDNSLYGPAGAVAYLQPARRHIHLGNLFAQDQIDLTSSLKLTLGVKLESNSFSGDDVMPNLRLAWSTPGGGLVWGAVSRAVRAPSRIDRDLTLGTFLLPSAFEPETVIAYEAGYRATPLPNASLSVSVFYNDYDGLRTVGPLNGALAFRNGAEGETWGLEAWGSYDVRPNWRLSVGVSTLERAFRLKPGEVDIGGIASKGFDPDYQVLLTSQSRLTDRIDLNVRLRSVGALPDGVTPSYTEADLRLGYRISDRAELALVGENLLNDQHFETQDPARRLSFGRSLSGALRLRF